MKNFLRFVWPFLTISVMDLGMAVNTSSPSCPWTCRRRRRWCWTGSQTSEDPVGFFLFAWLHDPSRGFKGMLLGSLLYTLWTMRLWNPWNLLCFFLQSHSWGFSLSCLVWGKFQMWQNAWHPNHSVLVHLFLHIISQGEQVHVAWVALIPHWGNTNLAKENHGKSKDQSEQLDQIPSLD